MKIEEQVLSREQMAHLVELGVDTSDASMYWIRAERMEGFRKHNLIDNDLGKWRLSLSRKLIVPAAWKVEYIPTYTIGDLIEKLPKKIGVYELLLDTSINFVKYVEWVDGIPRIIEFSKYKNDSSLKDSLYEMLCWVSKNHEKLIR